MAGSQEDTPQHNGAWVTSVKEFTKVSSAWRHLQTVKYLGVFDGKDVQSRFIPGDNSIRRSLLGSENISLCNQPLGKFKPDQCIHYCYPLENKISADFDSMYNIEDWKELFKGD